MRRTCIGHGSVESFVYFSYERALPHSESSRKERKFTYPCSMRLTIYFWEVIWQSGKNVGNIKLGEN